MSSKTVKILNGPNKFDFIMHLMEPELPGTGKPRTSHFETEGPTFTLFRNSIQVTAVNRREMDGAGIAQKDVYEFRGHVFAGEDWVANVEGVYNTKNRSGYLIIHRPDTK